MPPKKTREALDPNRFVRSPNLDVRGTVALAIKLLGLVPSSSDARDAELVKRGRAVARDLRESTVALQGAWSARDAAAPIKVKPLDLAADAAWAALLGRLESWAGLAADPDAAADSARAAALIAAIFPLGLEFTQLELHSQWAESEKRVQRIATDGLRDDLARLAGEIFVARLERTHAALGRALGLDGRPADEEPKPTVDLLEGIRDVQRAISAYALELLSVHRTASDALATKVVAALSPIEEFRASARPAPTTKEEPAGPVGPETPVPPVPES